ncbi:zinc finger CCCH-type with G patch domain-containing protein-like isoform X2 [Clavelina lepadiformis]
MKELIDLTEESVLSHEKSKLLAILDEIADDNNETGDHHTNAQNGEQGICSDVDNQSKSMDDEMTLFYAGVNSAQDNGSSQGVMAETSKSKKVSGRLDGGGHMTPQVAEEITNDEDFYVDDYSDLSGENFNFNEDFLETIEDSDDITGVRCRAPFRTEWSGVQYHNAMIMDVINETNNSKKEYSDPKIFVKVLFLNPTLIEMKPCHFMLEGKCKFSSRECKFSHGHTVSLYVLRKFSEPDFSSFKAGSTCVAKHPDGIWHPATLLETHENHQYTVQFSHQNLTTTLNIDEVFPSLQNDIDEYSSSSSDEDDVIEVNDRQEIAQDSSSSEQAKLGAWEKYTNGFGSKMLMKFGYKAGEGLGKDGKGRVEPVPVVVLPAGKSLDHCMMIKEKKMRNNTAAATSSSSLPKRHKHTVFHFINKTLGDRNKKDDRLKKLLPKDSFGINKPMKSSGPCKIKAELLKNDSKIKQLKDKISKVKDAIRRNRERNPGVAKQMQGKLKQLQSELDSVRSESSVIELHQKRAETHRKMTKF